MKLSTLSILCMIVLLCISGILMLLFFIMGATNNVLRILAICSMVSSVITRLIFDAIERKSKDKK